MLDDTDLEIVATSGGGNGGCLGAVVSLVITLIVWYFVSQNHDECGKKHCAHGAPTLQNHACQCVEAPDP